MAAKSGFNWSAFFFGALSLLLLLLVIGATIAFGGLFPIAATTPHSTPVRDLIEVTRDKAVERSAAGLKAPAFSAADIQEGAAHFKGMCQECHGGPGVEREEFAGAMNPRPPDLAKATDDLSVEQVFWIAKNGLKMTGMPAFGKTDEDEELWKIAAFVKQIEKVSPQQYAAIAKAHEAEGGEGEHER
jgi:mono/diheme cytochrome c family protein